MCAIPSALPGRRFGRPCDRTARIARAVSIPTAHRGDSESIANVFHRSHKGRKVLARQGGSGGRLRDPPAERPGLGVSMTLSKSKGMVSTDAYATAADFERIFTDHMSGLYLLSFLLAGDPGKAETVFAAGVEECTGGKRVFKEWARSWARRSIIRSAIRIVGPQQNSKNGVQSSAVARAIRHCP